MTWGGMLSAEVVDVDVDAVAEAEAGAECCLMLLVMLMRSWPGQSAVAAFIYLARRREKKAARRFWDGTQGRCRTGEPTRDATLPLPLRLRAGVLIRPLVGPAREARNASAQRAFRP